MSTAANASCPKTCVQHASRGPNPLLVALIITVCSFAALDDGEVMGCSVSVENPAGQQVAFSAFAVFSGGQTVALHHPERFSGNGREPEPPDRINRSEGRSVTNSEHPDTTKCGQIFSVLRDPLTWTFQLNPWSEIDSSMRNPAHESEKHT